MSKQNKGPFNPPYLCINCNRPKYGRKGETRTICTCDKPGPAIDHELIDALQSAQAFTPESLIKALPQILDIMNYRKDLSNRLSVEANEVEKKVVLISFERTKETILKLLAL